MKRLSSHLFAWEEAGQDRPSGQARRVVIQFPYSGGSLHSLREYCRLLPGSRHLAVHYPGRGLRMDDDPADSIAEIANAVTSEYLSLDEYAGDSTGPLLIGHSMGGYVAFESACSFEAAGRPCAGLVLSSSLPPDTPVSGNSPLRILADGRELDDASDETLTSVLAAAGVMPPEIIGEAELLAMLLPALRHDCGLSARYSGPQSKASCPVIAMGGLDDAAVPPASLNAWARFTADSFSVQLWPGGHLWFRGASAAVGEAIEHAIATVPSMARRNGGIATPRAILKEAEVTQSDP